MKIIVNGVVACVGLICTGSVVKTWLKGVNDKEISEIKLAEAKANARQAEAEAKTKGSTNTP